MTAMDLCHHGRWGALLLCSLLVACASEPVSLDARPGGAPSVPRVTAPIAYLHSKDFRQDLRTVEPYGNQYYVPLKTGEASDRALRNAYAQVFANAREVGSLEEASTLAAAGLPVATIEPSIVRLDYLNASGRLWGPYYSEIVYGFALYDPAGTRVAEWRVSGFGEFDMNRESKERRPDFPRGETAVLIEAPRRAVENGVAGFVAGFERLPELTRLARNLPLAGANAPPGAQVTRTVASAMEAEYPGVLALRVEIAAVPEPPKELVKEAPKTPYVLPIRLRLHNASAHRLALDPSDAQWVPQGMPATPISPLPGRVASAALTKRPFGLAIGVMSPGLGMLPALLSGLLSAAENERQQQELAAWTAAIESDLLVAGVAGAGGDRNGILYFPRPPKVAGGMIVIPIVDLDDAVRYTVRVPLPVQ